MSEAGHRLANHTWSHPFLPDLMVAELERMATEHVTAEELDRAHGQICGGTVLGMESTGARMSRLGRSELVLGEFVDLTDSLDRVRAVDAEHVRAVAARLVEGEWASVVVGPEV